MKHIIIAILFLLPITVSAQLLRSYGVVEIGSTFPTSSVTGAKFAYRTTDSSYYRWVSGNTWVKVIEPSIIPDTLYLTEEIGTSYKVSGDTINLTPYLLKSDTTAMLVRYIERGDTASMLTNYPSTAGYGILKSSKTIRADTTSPNGLATRLFAKTLPTNILTGQAAYSNGTNLVGNPDFVFSATRPTLRIGSTTSSSSTTPSLLDLGGTFSSVQGANPKLTLYSSGSAFAGFGVSSAQMDYIVGSGVSHSFYVGGTRTGYINNNGINLPSSKTLKFDAAGATATTPMVDLAGGVAGFGLEFGFVTHIAAASSGHNFYVNGSSLAGRFTSTSNFLLGTTTDVPTSILTARSTTKSSSPFPFHTTAESNAITGVAGNFEWLTDGLGPGFSWHNGTRKAYGLESTASTFTPGSLIFAGSTGQATQDNAGLFWRDDVNRLGIGTASPSTALTVVGAITATSDGHRLGNFQVLTSGSASTTGGGVTMTGTDQIVDFQFGAQGMRFRHWANTTMGLTSFDRNVTVFRGGFGGTINLPNLRGSVFKLEPTINFTGVNTNNKVTGLYYAPILTSLLTARNIAFENTTGDLVFGSTSGSVYINDSIQNSVAILTMKSLNKGVLLPRMKATQRIAIPSPLNSLLLYQFDATRGFYTYDSITTTYKRLLWDGDDTNIGNSNLTSTGDRTYNGGGFDLNFTSLDTLNEHYQQKREYINGNQIIRARGTTIRDYDIFGALNIQNRGDSACLIRMVRYAGIQSDWTIRNDGTQLALSANGGLDDYFRFYDNGDFRFTDYVNALTDVFDIIKPVKLTGLGTGTATTILGKTSTNEIVPVSISSSLKTSGGVLDLKRKSLIDSLPVASVTIDAAAHNLAINNLTDLDFDTDGGNASIHLDDDNFNVQSNTEITLNTNQDAGLTLNSTANIYGANTEGVIGFKAGGEQWLWHYVNDDADPDTAMTLNTVGNLAYLKLQDYGNGNINSTLLSEYPGKHIPAFTTSGKVLEYRLARDTFIEDVALFSVGTMMYNCQELTIVSSMTVLAGSNQEIRFPDAAEEYRGKKIIVYSKKKDAGIYLPEIKVVGGVSRLYFTTNPGVGGTDPSSQSSLLIDDTTWSDHGTSFEFTCLKIDNTPSYRWVLKQR